MSALESPEGHNAGYSTQICKGTYAPSIRETEFRVKCIFQAFTHFCVAFLLNRENCILLFEACKHTLKSKCTPGKTVLWLKSLATFRSVRNFLESQTFSPVPCKLTVSIFQQNKILVLKSLNVLATTQKTAHIFFSLILLLRALSPFVSSV